MTINKKDEKIASFVKKNAKIHGVKILRNFSYIYKLHSNLFSNSRGGSSAPEAGKT